MVMLVGIGFVAILTASVAQRFVAEQVTGDLDAAEQEIEHDAEASEALVLAELREMQRRLRDLETSIQRLAAGRAAP